VGWLYRGSMLQKLQGRPWGVLLSTLCLGAELQQREDQSCEVVLFQGPQQTQAQTRACSWAGTSARLSLLQGCWPSSLRLCNGGSGDGVNGADVLALV